jgi:hypothetical protein
MHSKIGTKLRSVSSDKVKLHTEIPVNRWVIGKIERADAVRVGKNHPQLGLYL